MALYVRITAIASVVKEFPQTSNIPFERDFIVALNHCGKTSQVVHLYASGDEKEYILARFDNLPTTKGDSCYWVGDMANFICANLT